MTFLQLQQRVADETGLSITTDATAIKAWINGAYQQLSGYFNWPWLLTNFTLQTERDITTGTATVSAGGTAVTLSSGPTNSVATNYMIQFTGSSDNWYYISAHVAASTSLTLANAFVGSSNYTAGAYIIRRVFYSLPTTVDRVLDLRQAVTKTPVTGIDASTFDRMLPDPSATGTPEYYYLTGAASTGAWQLGFFPTPSAVINIQGRGWKTITELSADADLPLIPAKWHNALVFLALALYGHDFIDDSRVQSATSRAKEIVQEMVKQSSPVPGRINVIQPWDSRVPQNSPRLPSNYPQGWW